MMCCSFSCGTQESIDRGEEFSKKVTITSVSESPDGGRCLEIQYVVDSDQTCWPLAYL